MLQTRRSEPLAYIAWLSHSVPRTPVYGSSEGTLGVTMSNPASADTSRSASPSGGQEPKPRLVSGSLKDRIAKFNNPSAAPLLPTHPFGSAGPGSGAAGPPGKKGLYGNRIPSLDPKSAGHVPLPGRKVSERGGLIGNRIPSSVSGSNVAGLAGSGSGSPGSNTAGSASPTGPANAPEPKAPVTSLGIGRPPSPTGSVGSSTHSQPGESGSPSTSRSSSPPTSLGGGLPPSLLAATLPDVGGPGAMTPSSTRADAGEEDSDRSAPSTPIVGAAIQLPPAEYDLVPGNLKLAAAAQMSRGLSGSSVTALRSFAPSVTSSLASQYDPSSAGNEEKQMMQDVSGISTPTGTPRAAYKEFDGSNRGEGSVVDEGSVMGDGDQHSQRDMENVSKRLEGLAVNQDQHDDDDEEPRDQSPRIQQSADEDVEMASVDQASEDHPTPLGDIPDPIDDVQIAPPAQRSATQTKTPEQSDPGSGSPDVPHVTDVTDEASTTEKPNTASKHNSKAKPAKDDDPNKADDLAALKRGDLSRSPAPKAKDPISAGAIDSLASSGFRQNFDEQPVPAADNKDQGGHAGTRFLDVDKPDETITPSEAESNAGGVEALGEKEDTADDHEKGEKEPVKVLGPEMEMRPATPVQQGGTLSKEDQAAESGTAKGIRRTHQQRAGEDVQIDIKKSDDSDGEGDTGDKDHRGMRAPGGIEADLDDPAKNDFVNEAFSGDLEAYAEPDEEAKEGDLGTLAPPSHVEHVGPEDVSALEKVGVGQSAVAEAKAARVTSDIAEGNSLQHPDAQSEKEAADLEELDKREGKTYAGELAKAKQEASAGHHKDNAVVESLHFELADGTPLHPDGDLESLPVAAKGGDGRKANTDRDAPAEEELMELPTSEGSTVQVPKHPDPAVDSATSEKLEETGSTEPNSNDSSRDKPHSKDSDMVELPTSDGSTVQVPRRMNVDEEEGNPSSPDQPAAHAGEPSPSADLPTKSDDPIPTEAAHLAGKPLQLHVEPAPIAQPAGDADMDSTREKDDAPTPPEPSRTPAPPDFPEPPHDDPTGGSPADIDPPLSARSTTTQASDKSDLDPAIMRAFPDVPDEEHPRVEIHVSPHVTPSKPSPFRAHASASSSDPQSPSRLRNEADAPQTPAAGGRAHADTTSGGGLEVVSPNEGGAAGLAGKKSSKRYSPKSPLLGDEDPGDFIPGEEGWAIVTKGRED